MLTLFCALALTTGQAQIRTFTDTGLSSGTATATATNTTPATLSCYSPLTKERPVTTTIHFEAAETSGTTAGTVSLYGSVDGTNYRAISSTTFTATDVATQGFIWTLTGSPVPYYRVTWTGSGTMVDTFTAKLYTN